MKKFTFTFYNSSSVIEDVKLDKNFLQRKIVDPVWLMKEYKPQVISIEEAIKCHLELAQESMLNNMNGFMFARFILDMNTKKKVLISLKSLKI